MHKVKKDIGDKYSTAVSWKVQHITAQDEILTHTQALSRVLHKIILMQSSPAGVQLVIRPHFQKKGMQKLLNLNTVA